MVPVAPNVAPAISLELDVDDGEVENYEVGQTVAPERYCFQCICELQDEYFPSL